MNSDLVKYYAIPAIACICVAAIEIVALLNGINGVALKSSYITIGAIAGGATAAHRREETYRRVYDNCMAGR